MTDLVMEERMKKHTYSLLTKQLHKNIYMKKQKTKQQHPSSSLIIFSYPPPPITKWKQQKQQQTRKRPPPKKKTPHTTTTKTRKSWQWMEQLDNRDSERLKGTQPKQCNVEGLYMLISIQGWNCNHYYSIAVDCIKTGMCSGKKYKNTVEQ